jgi:alpha-ribazole phosphatase
MRIAFVRHTAVEVAPGTCYGRLDLPLAATAAEDIAGVAARLAGFGATRIWSSPASRCRLLAEALAAATSTDPVFDDRLLELHLGDWEGCSWDNVPRTDIDRWVADPLGFAAPGGEAGHTLISRVTAAFEEIAAHPGDHVVVTHGGPLRVLSALGRRTAIDLLSPAPGLGSIEIVEI